MADFKVRLHRIRTYRKHSQAAEKCAVLMCPLCVIFCSCCCSVVKSEAAPLKLSPAKLLNFGARVGIVKEIRKQKRALVGTSKSAARQDVEVICLSSDSETSPKKARQEPKRHLCMTPPNTQPSQTKGSTQSPNFQSTRI